MPADRAGPPPGRGSPCEKVALNRRFCRRSGSSARIERISRMKPMSSMRSASSRTRISTRAEVDRPLASMVEQPAGRGDHDLRTAAQRTRPGRGSRRRRRWRSSAAVRRHRRERSPRPASPARGWGPGSGRGCAAAGRCGAAVAARRCSIGSTKAAVLPVPVWAPASRSRPASTQRNRLALDGGGFGIALRRDGAEQFGRKPERREGQGNGS